MAQDIERATNGWLTARSLRDPAMRELLDEARFGWRWEPTLVEVNGERVRVYTGVTMRSRLVVGLGPQRAVRVAQVVQQALAPQAVVDQGRRTLLKRGAMLAGLLVMPSAAYAKEPKPLPPAMPDPATLEKEQKKRLDAIHKIEKHLRIVADGTIEIKEKKAEKVGVDQQLFDELMLALAGTNQLIRSGTLKTSEVELHTPAEAEAGGQKAATGAEQGVATPDGMSTLACAGVTRGQLYWWGYRRFLNSCDTNRLLAALLLAEIPVGICILLLPGGQIPCGLVGLALLAWAGRIQWAAANGRGIYIDWNVFWPPTTIVGYINGVGSQ